MNLNRKGYLTVEVILASVVAVTIALFLMEITIKLVNITDEAYVDTDMLTDKTLIIKNIKESIEEDIKNNGGIKQIACNTSTCQINFCQNFSTIQVINKTNNNDNNQIKYNNYIKNINNNLTNIKIESSEITSTSGYILFNITADSKFSKEPFAAEIIIYNNRTCE